ncbi:MAG: amidohydrolase family protein [Planctomycetota bacterium]|nr:amidohydrolase family protein [Planctomycetota bacterium]
MRVTDSHVHLWTDEPTRYPDANPRPAYMFRRRYEPADFFAQAGPSGVDRAVLVQSDNYGPDHRYLTDVIASDPRKFAGIARLDPFPPTPPGAEGVTSLIAVSRLKALAERGFRGFRVLALGQEANDRSFDAPWFAAIARAIAESPGLALCPLIDPAALPALDRLCGEFPAATVVIDHLARIGIGNAFREEDVARLVALARRPRVFVKVSAFYGLGTGKPPHAELAPLIRRLYDAFGPNRLMWGSDCPYQTQHEDYADAIALITQGLPFLSTDDREQILHRTADEVFFGRA